ncbi:MAG: hypothetical protein M1827_000969 [Pycnora praestabilis]|nr:MAG: hypothetical protein M1827_000969 [Pycnora praestabilis]
MPAIRALIQSSPSNDNIRPLGRQSLQPLLVTNPSQGHYQIPPHVIPPSAKSEGMFSASGKSLSNLEQQKAKPSLTSSETNESSNNDATLPTALEEDPNAGI